MKRKISGIIAGILIISTFAACSKTPETPVSSEPESEVSVVESSETPASTENKQADIVVIGAGGAGMTAAIQAKQDGAKDVIIIEKMPLVGGNTVRATGGMNAAGTEVQKAKGVEDSVDLMVEETLKGGKEKNNPELVAKLAENSVDAVNWINSIGGDISDVGRAGGASVDRIHRPTGGLAIGPMLVTTLKAEVEKNGIPVLLETKAEEILLNEAGAVKGVRVTGPEGEYTIDCTAVVLATGGFGANPEMVVKYNPKLEGFKTTNHPGATGDGIVMAEQIGVELVDIDQIQTHPTVEPNSATMYTEGVRGEGAILVNKEGKRFINELETRDVVSEAILAQTEQVSFLVFDQTVRDNLKAIEEYISAGIITEADTLEELAEKLGIDKAAFVKTMADYSGYVTAKTDSEFAREDMKQPLTTPKFYAGLCAPAIHHTMGGVKINTNSEVLKADGTLVGGLFAAGEVTGGVHGANRLGGNAITDVEVFGRIAGSSALAYVEANGGQTEAEIAAPAASEEAAKPEFAGNYVDGVYTGTAKGMNGDVTVEVTVEGGNVVSIVMADHKETPGIYEAAEKGVIASIIKTQSPEVDTVSGATMTSNAIKEGVKLALEGKTAEASTETSTTESSPETSTTEASTASSEVSTTSSVTSTEEASVKAAA